MKKSMIEYDYSKLKGKLRELAITGKQFAEDIGVSEQTLYKKFSHNSYFTQTEIEKGMKSIKEPMSKVKVYFFTKKVAKIETK